MNWLSFTNPLMLAGLAAVGLPVLIHFLTRARPRRIAYPPFRFLLEACAGQQAVHRLRTIILLTLRCLAVLALVLLFARPFVKPTGPATGSEAARRVVLVLDASLSMRAVQQGVPLFARAQSEAAEILRALESGSEAAVILAGATPRPLLPALSRNLPALHDELVKADATFENGDPAASLALAARMLGGSGTIYVFSDFQRSNWETASELPGGIRCNLRSVTGAALDNVALTAARLVPAEPVVGEPAEVICTIFNCSPRSRQETVRLELGDFTREQGVTVPPFGVTEAAFNVSFPRAGSFAGTVALQPDDLREDNTRYLAANVGKALQVLLISDTEPNDPRTAAFYLSRALAPSPQAAPGISVVRRHSQDADRGILETADVFVLAAPALLTGEGVETISRRVNDGARLIVFLDGPTAPMLMPATFSPSFILQQPITSADGDAVIAGPHSLFAESDAGDLAALRFHRHYLTQTREAHENDILLAYADGSAALALTPVGRGMAAFVNFPLTPDGGDFIGSPMFPAMLHELLRALRRNSEDRMVTPGNAWSLDVPTSSDSPLTVLDPKNRPVPAQVVASGRVIRLALPTARVPGVYRVSQNETLLGEAVVNVDPRESDTRPIALENLKSAAGALVSVVREEGDLQLAGRTRPLWPQLAAAAALFIALEMLLLAVWRRPTVPGGSPDAPQGPGVRQSSGAFEQVSASDSARGLAHSRTLGREIVEDRA